MGWIRRRKENKVARMEALLEAYEERLQHKTTLINEQESMLLTAQQQIDNLEECVQALQRDQERMQAEMDWYEEACSQLHAEWQNGMKRWDEADELEKENYRLWQENVALRASLVKYNPAEACWICGGK